MEIKLFDRKVKQNVMQEECDLSELISPSSERYSVLGKIRKLRKLPWLKDVSSKVVIPEAFFYAIVDPSLWPNVEKIMKNNQEFLRVILKDEDVPEGIKEQLFPPSSSLHSSRVETIPLSSLHSSRVETIPSSSLHSSLDLPFPEELTIEILVRNNPYSLRNLSKTSRQFEDILSRREVLNKISSYWGLPKASSISNLSDVWKVSNIVEDDEDKKHFFPSEILLHYMMEKNEDKSIETLEKIEENFDLFSRNFIVLAVVLGLKKLYFRLLRKHKDGLTGEYEWDEEISQNILAGKKSRRIPQKKFRKCIYPAEHILIRRTVEELQEEIDRLRWK